MIAKNKLKIPDRYPGSVCLLLDNIRSVHNVGSIFRTAETIGIYRIYCAGTTPLPVDRFGKKRSDFSKVALGAEEMLDWEHIESTSTPRLIHQLKKENFKIIALEQAPNSIDYKEIQPTRINNVLIVLGNEVDGISPALLKLAD